MAEPLHPSVTEFKELAQTFTVVPVWREVLADLETPVSVFLKLVGGGEGFLLESVEHGERWGRYSFVGRDPSLTLIARAGSVRWLEGEPDADRLDALVDDLARPLAYQPVAPPTDIAEGGELPPFRSSMGGGAYHRAVEAAREHILAGDIFQVVLAQRFDFELGCDPFDVYRVLRQVNPSPYMYFLRGSDGPGGSGVSPGVITICGSSPEPMVQLLDGRVISRPIAGTRRRGRDDAADRRLAGELIEHPKERAEHVMLVDLARNDVGRVVRFGTEQVDELMTLERYSHVMHLTSQVSGELRPGQGPVDVLRATFPAGTVSGAPKVRAMEIIDGLEPVKRGPHAGVVGYVDFSGNLDSA